MFNKKPRKRKDDVGGYLFGEVILDIITARKKIYRPAYFYYVRNYVPFEIKENVLEIALKQGVVFYDVESNFDIEDPSTPLSHSVFLKMFFDNYLKKRSKETKIKLDENYQKQVFRYETLAEPVGRSLKLFKEGSDTDKELVKFILNQNNIHLDKFHKRYYQTLLEKIREL